MTGTDNLLKDGIRDTLQAFDSPCSVLRDPRYCRKDKCNMIIGIELNLNYLAYGALFVFKIERCKRVFA